MNEGRLLRYRPKSSKIKLSFATGFWLKTFLQWCFYADDAKNDHFAQRYQSEHIYGLQKSKSDEAAFERLHRMKQQAVTFRERRAILKQPKSEAVYLTPQKGIRMTVPVFQMVRVNDRSFEIMRWSSDAPIAILLPGAFGGIRGYAALGSELQSLGVPVAGMNPRGCGGSRGPLDGVTLRDLAQDVIDVLGAVCVAPTFVIGHAGGNRVARMVAGIRPDLIRGIVLLAAGGMVPPDREAQAALSQLMSDNVDRAEQQRLNRIAMFAPSSRIPDQHFDVPDRSAEFGRVFFAALATTPMSEWWAGGSSPILVIQGLQDRIAPPANGHHLKTEFPDRVEVVDLDGAGHALCTEKPKEIAEFVADFARRHTSRMD